MQYLGDYEDDYSTLNFTFTTLANATDTPTVLAGSPVITVYKGSSTTGKTSAESYITLDIDFASKVGLNHVLIDLSGDAFFVVGEDYSVVITTGTVSTSRVGTVIAIFSIENRAPVTDVSAVLVDSAAIVVGVIDNATGADVATDVVALKAETVSILTDTAEIGVGGAGLGDLGGMSTAMKAEVNVEAKDVLVTDTQAELAQGAPAITASVATMVKTIYKFMIAKQETTSTEIKVYNSDESTVDHKSTISDDGATSTKGEFKTG